MYDGNEKSLKILIDLSVTIRRILHDICHVIRHFVGVHRKGLQSLRQRTTENFSTYFRYGI